MNGRPVKTLEQIPACTGRNYGFGAAMMENTGERFTVWNITAKPVPAGKLVMCQHTAGGKWIITAVEDTNG
jgi:hypothetical protein